MNETEIKQLFADYDEWWIDDDEINGNAALVAAFIAKRSRMGEVVKLMLRAMRWERDHPSTQSN